MRLRHLLLKHVGQSTLTVLLENIICCPKHACFLLHFYSCTLCFLNEVTETCSSTFRQWKIFCENIVVINCTYLPAFLIIRFQINTTDDCSKRNIYKLSCISWRLLPGLLLISIPLRHLLSADSSHRRSCFRQLSAADVTPGTAASHHTLAVFGQTTSVVSCALILAVLSDWRIQLWGTTCKCIYLYHRRSQL